MNKEWKVKGDAGDVSQGLDNGETADTTGKLREEVQVGPMPFRQEGRPLIQRSRGAGTSDTTYCGIIRTPHGTSRGIPWDLPWEFPLPM